MFHKISHRLAVLIVVSLLGLVISSVNGLYQLNQSNKNLIDVGQNALPSIEKLASVRSNFLQLRVDLYIHLLTKDAGPMAELEKKIHALADTGKADLAYYEKNLVNDDTDRQLLQDDLRLLNDYTANLDQAIQLSRDNQDEEAAEYIAKTLRPRGDATMDALEKHMQFNDKLAAVSVADSANDFAHALTTSLVLVGVTVLLLLFVAWSTYRTVIGTTRNAQIEVQRVVNDLDFSRGLAITGRDEISELLHVFNGLIAKLRSGLQEIQNGANSLNDASSALSFAAKQVGEGSQSQADAAAAMAANVEEVTVSINHVAEQTSEANGLVRAAGAQAQEGRAAVQAVTQQIESIANLVNEAATEIKRLEESGHQIGSVVNVIKEVADQTNLLALNAAIEAARAGEQGRGFAVVADEVRKLAERTASSTIEISQMVAEIQQRSRDVAGRMGGAVESVKQGVAQSQVTQQSMDQIAERAQASVQLVEEVSSSLREQTIASNAIATQVERVAQMSEENSQAATRSTDLSAHLAELAENMLNVVRHYRL